MADESRVATSSPKGALGKVKVLEWAQFVAGPYCAKLLGDNGAEVIKVEQPGLGDEARRRGPFPQDIPHAERSALFLYLNTNKKGVTLDVTTETGREVFRKLIEHVDILVEDNPPHLLEERGLSYENLRKVNPRLIMASITPFGQTGPYRDYKAYYLNTFHGSGFGYLTPAAPGDPEVLKRTPIMLGGFLTEYYSGVSAAIGTLAALYVRRMTGEGQHIDVSKLETALLPQKEAIARCQSDGEVLNRASVIGAASWGGTLPCKDGYVLMGGSQPNQFAAVLNLMGNPEWSRDEKFRPDQIHLHGSEMQPYVRAWVAERCKEDIWHDGQRRGAPLGAVYTVGEVLQSDHLKARGFFVEIDHPEVGRLLYPSVPYKLSKTPARFERPAPLLGEHNEEVYCECLGYSPQDLARLKGTGII